MQRYLIIFAMTAGLTLLAACGLSWWFEPIEGDLTRIGKYSERDFGWNADQVPIAVRANGKVVKSPDVAVLGDSFSAGNIWQSALAQQTGLNTQSFNYSQNECIGAWADIAARNPATGTVVIETVERAFVSRFKDVTSCSGTSITPWESVAGSTARQRLTWPMQMHVQHTALVALQTFKMRRVGATGILQDKVVNVPMDPLCGKFSHRAQGRFLYFGEDEEKWEWTAAEVANAVANVARLQAIVQGHGKRFVFVVVPDKSSVYRSCLTLPENIRGTPPVNITAELIAGGVRIPDVLGQLQQVSSKVVDLYNPDNTHFGTTGYLALARMVQPYVAVK